MNSLPACNDETMRITRQIEEYSLKFCPQIFLTPEEHLHAGVYSRTIFVPKGVVLTGALMKLPTLLICTGDMQMTAGNSVVRVQGVHIFEGEKGRKSVFHALEDSSITMVFASQARTFDEAEKEFTDEHLQEKDKCQEVSALPQRLTLQ